MQEKQPLFYLLCGAAAQEMDMSSCHSQTSAILAAAEARSQLWDVSRLPVSCGIPHLASCGHAHELELIPTVHAFIQAVQLTICLCSRKH